MSKCLTITETCRRGISIKLWSLSLFLDNSLVPSHGSTNIDGPILAQLLAVVCREFDTLGIDDTYVLVWSTQTEDARIATCGRIPNVVTMLVIEIS